MTRISGCIPLFHFTSCFEVLLCFFLFLFVCFFIMERKAFNNNQKTQSIADTLVWQAEDPGKRKSPLFQAQQSLSGMATCQYSEKQKQNHKGAHRGRQYEQGQSTGLLWRQRKNTSNWRAKGRKQCYQVHLNTKPPSHVAPWLTNRPRNQEVPGSMPGLLLHPQ